MIALIVLGSAAVLAAAYLVYGRFLARRLQLDDFKLMLAVMLLMSMWSLVLLVKPFLSGSTGFDSLLSAVLGMVLLLLCLFLLAETARVLRRGRADGEEHEQRS